MKRKLTQLLLSALLLSACLPLGMSRRDFDTDPQGGTNNSGSGNGNASNGGSARTGSRHHGINLTGVVDYQQTPFTAIVFRPPGVDGATPYPVDAYGYPTTDGTLMTQAFGAPDGEYQLTYDGGGTNTFLIVNGLGPQNQQCTSGCTFHLTHGNVGDNMFLTMVNVDPAKPIRNLRVVPVGTPPDKIFTDEYLARIAPYGTLRFMDWTVTNTSTAENWADRTKPDALTQSAAAGVAWELVVALANTTMKDLWICVPRKANDDYIRQLAKLLIGSVRPGLRIYVEYANETWNGGFAVFQQMLDEGAVNPALQYPGNSFPTNQWWLGAQQAAFHLANISRIFREELAVAQTMGRPTAPPELKFVLSGQGVNPWLTEGALEYLNHTYAAQGGSNAVIDALANAPYFSLQDTVNNTANLTHDQMFDSMKVDIDSVWIPKTVEWQALAQANGLQLYTYEVGQNLIPNLGHVSNFNTKITAQFQTRMKTDVYDRFFKNAVVREAYALQMHFSLIYSPGPWGNWGIDAYSFNADNAYPACKNAAVGSLETVTDGNGNIIWARKGYCAKKHAIMETIAVDGD